MSNFSFLIFFAVGVVVFKMWRRSRDPDLINEVYRGLRHIAYRDVHRGEFARAERYEKMAEALMLGQAYVRLEKQVVDVACVRNVERLVSQSMDYSVLEECEIYRQNHKHACYESVGRLSSDLEKLIQKSLG